MSMRAVGPIALVALLAACASPDRGESIDTTKQRFTSDQAVLLDFAFDGTLVADTADDGRLRTLIHAQLMYSVGQLNGEGAVGRHERLELSAIAATAIGADRYSVTYRAKLPVAWSKKSVPASYAFALPARVGEADQVAFATKYGASCVDASAGTGEMHPGRMFLFYRPQQPACTLAADDVATFSATITPSKETSSGKYPEYHRIWDDKTLEVVAIFSRAQHEVTPDDEGVFAHEAFLERVREYLDALKPVAVGGSSEVNATTFDVTLADGRRIKIHSRLVGAELAAEEGTFDPWYDAHTREADVILYSGHAGLGANIRTLMTKGAFRAGKYLIWAANGCDTFAYVDRTLADRRAKLNADDPNGTKYMDVVSNVMPGYFGTTPETSMTFIEAMVEKKKTYQQIFENIDPSQVIVVTGEEDNEYQPPSPEPVPTSTPAAPKDDDAEPTPSNVDPIPDQRSRTNGCSIGSSSRESGPLALVGLAAFAMAIVRRRLRARSAYVGD